MAGAVLAGGRSSRFGRDKALVEVDGMPMGAHVVAVLRRSGIGDVVVVGGDADRAAQLGAPVIADRWPGQGPLGGIITALDHLAARSRDDPRRRGARGEQDGVVVVAACDLPRLDPDTVRVLTDASAADPDALVAVPIVDGRLQVLCAAWRRRALPQLVAAFDAGERSPSRAVAALAHVAVPGVDAAILADVDTPLDLDRLHHR